MQRRLRIARNVSIVAALLVLACSSVWAQATAQVTGVVKDQTGAVLPGVEVTLTQTATGFIRKVVTDETGSYVATSLPVGPYQFEAGLPGFKTYVQTGIVLQVNSNPTVNAVLEVGQVSDQVEVQADAALVETRSTGIGQMIDNQRVVELPLNGRQANELILLSGVANLGGGSGVNRGNSVYSATAISVAGGVSTGLYYSLDGGAHNDPYNNFNLPLPFPDALQEFKVETGAVPARYGQHAAGTVNAVTKSGANAFHGDLFEFVRNNAFNARNAFALTDDGLKRNQFGGTLGGPIAKNKLFFFGGYQGTTERSRPNTKKQWVPTPSMLAGDFTTMMSTACQPRQVNLPAQYGFNANRIDPTLLSPIAVAIVKRMPNPVDQCGLVQSTSRNSQTEHLITGKVDYQRSEKHSMFGRYMIGRKVVPTDFVTGDMLSLSQPTQTAQAQSLTLSDTYLFGSGTVSSWHGTVFRTLNDKYPPALFDEAEVGLNTVNNPFKKLITVSVANAFALPGGTVQPGHYNGTGFQLTEDLSFIRGAHQIETGADYTFRVFNGNSGNGVSPTFTFASTYTGNAMSDFLLGKLDNFQQRSDVVLYPRMHYLATYVQDTWKANSHLTVNAGVRWEPYLAAYSAKGWTTFFDKDKFDKGIKSTVFKNAPAGLFFAGDPDAPGNSYSANRWMHFAPRVGIAFDPKGDGLMTIRAAYGIYNDMPHLWYFYGAASATPWGYSVVLQKPANFANVFQDVPGGNPFPLKVDSNITFPQFGAYVTLPRDMKSTYVNQWNLSVQKQFGSNWLVAANYLGNSTIHFWTLSQGNPAIFDSTATTSNINQRRLLYRLNPTEGQYFGSINAVDDGGTVSYNGLLLSVQRRQANGVTIQGNYTLSHCIGDYFDGMPHPTSRVPSYASNRTFDRGNCDADRRHVVNISTVVETPRFAGKVARILGTGWQISGIMRMQSGGYFSVASGADTSLTGGATRRANQVLLDPYAADKNLDHWLNLAAFTRPAPGQYGNSANSIQGPGLITINLGLTRTFAVREGQTIQFRAEAFNAPNHLNPDNPDATITSGTFGRSLTAQDPRIMQFALKYVF